MKNKFNYVLTFTLLVLIVLLYAGCGLSTEDLTEQVKADIESNFEEQGIDISINDFSLVKKSDREYRGILKISGYGETESLVVNVTTDGDSFMWEIEGY